MTTITATELKQNLGYYLEKAETESFFISKNNKIIAKLESLKTEPQESISRFFKTIPSNGPTLEETRRMRIEEKLK